MTEMWNLLSYAETAMEMLDELSIPYHRVDKFSVNTRATGRFGQCRITTTNGVRKYTINISEVILDKRNGDRLLVQTLIHELLHTCDGCGNHGKLWQSYAEKVNRKFGLHVSRTTDVSMLNSEVRRQYNNSIKERSYVVECTGCHRRNYYQRAGKVVMHTDNYYCGACGGRLKLIAVKPGTQILRAK